MRKTHNHTPIQIGDPLLLTCRSSSAKQIEQVGYLQHRRGGTLCIDVDPEFRPAKGTQIRVSKLEGPKAKTAFSSEIVGRSRLHGHLPVLLIRDPQSPLPDKACAAYSIPAGIRAEIHWESNLAEYCAKTALLTDLSGEGGRIFTRSLPDVEKVFLKIVLPDAFVEEWSVPRKQRSQKKHRHSPPGIDPQRRHGNALLDQFSDIECHLVKSSIFRRGDLDLIHSLTLTFDQPHEGCFRLVRFLERQTLQRGITPTKQHLAA